jgi:hypothetical protein
MTLEEKASIVAGKGFALPGTSQKDNMPAKNASISGHTNAIARLNTPTLVFADGPSGIQWNVYNRKS